MNVPTSLFDYSSESACAFSPERSWVAEPYDVVRIKNRRYLGNKYALLPFIRRVVDENTVDVETFADVFAGTGAVASAFLDKTLTTNDILYCNYLCHVAWFSAETYSQSKISEFIAFFNSREGLEENYMTESFADTYFSRKDCSKIGFVRERIETAYQVGDLNRRERALLITSLIYAMDKIANTCGHYDAYRQGAAFEKSLHLRVPTPPRTASSENQCYNEDANELVKRVYSDVVYLDPPYNSRQYCDAYHLIENVARWEKPEVSGVARKMDRSALKSDYCTNKAVEAFERLIRDISARYVVLSYNNMAKKGNDRSNARISDDDIMRILTSKGEVTVFSEKHRAFSAGKSQIDNNEERLFLCRCK